MIKLDNSPAVKKFLDHFSRQDNADYSVKYVPLPHDSYQFTATKRIKGEPIQYSGMVTAQAIDEYGAGTALQDMRLRALKNFTAVYNGDLVVE